MTQDEIIEMATQVYGECNWHYSALLRLEAFVKLVEDKALAQRTWVGLTNDELTNLFYNTNLGQASAVAQAIELLKEKNT
jgi:hypothetical protein